MQTQKRIFAVICCCLFLFSCSLNNINGGADDPPSSPAGLSVTAQISRLDLTWDSVEEADYYCLYWTDDGTAPDESSTKADSLLDTTYSHDSLDFKKTYKYKVSAVNENGESDLSAVASGTPLVPPLGVPTGLATVTGAGNNTIEVNWDEHTEAGVTYTVYRRKSDETASTEVATGLIASTYTDKSIKFLRFKTWKRHNRNELQLKLVFFRLRKRREKNK